MLQKREFRLKFLNATVKFIPEVVGGKEVYSVLNAIDEHCGYITEELLDTILKLNKKEDVENNIINLGLDVYSYSNKKPSILSQKIIIDSTLAETLPDIQLSPVTYTKEAKPLTIKVEGLFCIQNFGKNVSIDFNQDTISCKSFSCTNKEPIDIKIDINTTSTLFEYINFSNFSVLDNRGNEINIHINTDGDYIKMEDLIFKSYRTDYTGPFQVSLDSGDGDLSVCQSEMALSVEEAPTEKDYCKISSSKRGIKIFKSFVSLLYPDSSLKVEKGIDLVGADVFVYGNNEINGNLKFDGDIKARGTLKMVHLKSYSSLQFQTRNCGFFDLTDSILNNGKKKIIFKRGETCLNTVNLENEGKSDLTFDTVDIRDSKLTNISDLHSCNIANTEVLNFTLNPYGRVFSFGPTKEYPKNGFHNKEDKEIFCSLKNISVELGSEDGVCDSIMINALKNTYNAPNIYFSFKGFKNEEGKPSSIFIRDFGVSTTLKGDDYCYPKFSTSSLYLRDGSIGSKTDDLANDFAIQSKENIFMLNTNLTIEPDNRDKGSFGIEAKKIELQDIDGEVKGSLIVSKEIEIVSKGEKSYIDIKESKIDGAFVYENIDRKRSLLRLQNVNADLGNSYLQCQDQVELENVAIKNNDKVGFKNVSLYCSEVKKVFQLIGVNACYTSFDNVYVGNTETDSLSYLKIGDKNDSPDSSILHTFKNVNIYLEGADTFIVKGGNPLSFTSCDFDGNTYIETKSSNPSIFYKVSGVNSKFTNSSLRFSSHDGYGTMINNSEVEGNFVCDSVREIAASYLENVKLESLDRVESCYLSAYIYENKEKRSSLINVNSNEEKILPKDTKLEIL